MRLWKTTIACAASALVLTLMAGCGGGGKGHGHGPCNTAGGCGNSGGGNGGPNATTISAQPQNQTALTGATATFTVTATGTDLQYQWLRNGTAITGANAASYTTPPVSHTDHAAQYSVVVAGKHGTVSSTAATLTLTLSPDQQIFEESILAANDSSYRIRWNLNYSGPQNPGINFAYSEHGNLTASPLTAGPQDVTPTVPFNITTTLPVVNPRPTRVLKDGAVLVVPAVQETRRYTYVGSHVRAESLAADGTTVAYSYILSDYSKVALSGAVASTPAEMAQWFNSFWSNAAILTAGAQYDAGAAYTKYTSTNEGDRYDAFDCTTATVTANISPCISNTTLQAAMTTGIPSNADARTYTLADGVLTTVGGVPVWVANAPRPVAATLTSTVTYRIYFELNGNVYTGALTRDGAVVGGTYYVANPGAPAVEDRLVFFPYQIRLNKAAHDSLKNALAL
ncbi:hypothetical protein LRS03_13625 [Rhizobacter sp. J219]|uniref:hypothetical protein n=1 Tax=Rhizobacter sp. J219 TaxID=2898430 RepID=UPI002150F75B|nr:hypothetical protein [Rhizobacter sp. J219]MCR5883839.1 hypothetical protein [Rhizobacter sp. J219]